MSAYAGAELHLLTRPTSSERSVGHSLRARVDVLLSRVRPFVGVGTPETRTRPNGEIDMRADRQEDELSGGLAFDLSRTRWSMASATSSGRHYENAFEDGVDLGRSLNETATITRPG